jgi:hypothetical protein
MESELRAWGGEFVHDQQQRRVHDPRTDVVAYGFLTVAAVVSGVQAAFLLHDAASWHAVQQGRITSWHHVPYLESLLALIDLAVLAVAVLVLVTTFSERPRRTAWATVAWLFIVLAAIFEWRLLGLEITVGDASPDSPLDLGPGYAVRAHEAVGATLMCTGALLASARALRSRRQHTSVPGT